MEFLPDEFYEYYLNRNFREIEKYVTKENVNLTHKNGHTLISWLCSLTQFETDEDIEFLDFLIKMGAQPKTYKDPSQRWTLLHWCAYKGKPKLMRKLIDLGEYINEINKFCCVPLQDCLYDARDKCAKILVDAGANIDFLRSDDGFGGVKRLERTLVNFICIRETMRDAAVQILGLSKCKSKVLGNYNNNVLQIIGKCIWGFRGRPQVKNEI